MSEQSIYQDFGTPPELSEVIGWMGHRLTYWPVYDHDNPNRVSIVV